MSARAMATRCFCPPDRLQTGSSHLSARPTRASSRSASVICARENRPSSAAGNVMSGRQALSTFCRQETGSTSAKS